VGASGNFAANDARFYAAAGASSGHDASDRIVYDTLTGRLYYDPDGHWPDWLQDSFDSFNAYLDWWDGVRGVGMERPEPPLVRDAHEFIDEHKV